MARRANSGRTGVYIYRPNEGRVACCHRIGMAGVTCRGGRYVRRYCCCNSFGCRTVVASRAHSGRIRVSVTTTFECRVIGGVCPCVTGIACRRRHDMCRGFLCGRNGRTVVTPKTVTQCWRGRCSDVVIFCTQERGIAVGVGRSVAHITLYVRVVDVTRMFNGYTFILSSMAGLAVALYIVCTTCGVNKRGTIEVIELGTGVTGFASRCRWDVCHWFEYHPRVQFCCGAMARDAITDKTLVIHRPASEFNCIGVTQSARLQRREVVSRFARDPL